MARPSSVPIDMALHTFCHFCTFRYHQQFRITLLVQSECICFLQYSETLYNFRMLFAHLSWIWVSCNLTSSFLCFFLFQLLQLKPTRYGVPHRENLTGRGDGMIYHTKGHALNPNKRDWKRYQSWQPEDPDSQRTSSETTPNSI
jgi:hypothetical protein